MVIGNQNLENIEDYDKTLLKGFARGFIKIIVLWIITKKRSHGYEIMNNLHTKECNYNSNISNTKHSSDDEENKSDTSPSPGPNRIYPILHELEKKGLVKGTWGTHGKRKIKYYEATQKGHNTIAKLKISFEHEAPVFVKEFWHDIVGKKLDNG